MAVITFPTTAGFMTIEPTIVAPPAQVTRGWTGVRKVITGSQGGASRWRVDVRPMVERADWREWTKFIRKMRGQANTTYLPLETGQHAYAEPLVVTGAAKGATSINVDGMTPSVAYIAGGLDFTIPIDGSRVQLVTATASVNASAGGTATITFEYPLRGAVADNAPLELSAPYVEVALLNAEQTYKKGQGGVYEFAFEFEEVY